MSDPIVEFDDEDRQIRVVLDPESEWREHVFSGLAKVALYRGCPDCGQADHIVAVDIEWLDEATIRQ